QHVATRVPPFLYFFGGGGGGGGRGGGGIGLRSGGQSLLNSSARLTQPLVHAEPAPGPATYQSDFHHRKARQWWRHQKDPARDSATLAAPSLLLLHTSGPKDADNRPPIDSRN